MTVTCPSCHKETVWEGNPFRPFCSERCQLIDLGAWISGEYQVTGEEGGLLPDREEEGEAEQEKDGVGHPGSSNGREEATLS